MDFSITISNFKKWIIDNFLLAFIGFLLLTTIIVVVATFLSYFTLLPFVYYSDQKYILINMTSFVNQNSSNFVSTFVNTMLTLGLIIFSALSLSSAQDTLKQSEKQQKQFQDEQKIRDIEKRLEFFYIPVDDIINSLNNIHVNSIFGYSKSDYERLKDIGKYSYLASEETYKAYENYMIAKCTKTKTTKCPYELKNISECNNYTNNCKYNFPGCIKTVSHCEYYDECIIEDQSGNFICKYCKSLKDKLTKDIKNYKNELVRLKE